MNSTTQPFGYMQYTSQLQSELTRMVNDQATPEVNKRDNQRLAERLTIKDSAFDDLVEHYASQTIPGNSGYQDDNISHWRIILLNLCRSTALRRWCGISGDTNSHKPGGLNHFIGLTNSRRTKDILKILKHSGLVTKVRGKKYKNQPQMNLYWPSAELRRDLLPFSLFAESPWVSDSQLIRINEPNDTYKEFVFQEPNQDYMDICAINEFIKPHQWACKAPITWPFKYTPFQSGRLITPFQNLQSRDYKIRINTLINGNPIVEVDFNANHLRMFLAFNKTDVIGEQDAYEPIVCESGVSRDKVKAFINVGLNNDSFEATRDVVARSKPYTSHAESRQIADAFHKLYPKLNLHCRFALVAMQLEGLILRDVLLRGAKAGILALPIHDAVAVEFDHQVWAKHTMEDAWQTLMTEFHKTAKTSVTIKFTS
jgi:hypothetical protein